ncbi:beta-phosphoglucomutase [Saprospiraceae bacterium]|nr:beta-phosphoglucomutase [Saprospiraceae bacterium]
MIKAFIFDLDGVIVDTVGYHYDSWVKLADSLDFKLDSKIKESLKGISRMVSLDLVLAQGNITATKVQKIKYAKQKNDWFIESLKAVNDNIILPGVKEFLQSTHDNNIKMAVASASKNAKSILAKTSIFDIFDSIKDGNDVKLSKPNPEVFFKAAKSIGVKPSEAIIFEDSVEGTTAAIDGGFKCVGIGKSEILQDAHIVVSDLTDLSADMIIRLLS